jgi:hypothetical protein
MGSIVPYIMENKKCLKPPTSHSIHGVKLNQQNPTNIILGHHPAVMSAIVFFFVKKKHILVYRHMFLLF